MCAIAFGVPMQFSKAHVEHYRTGHRHPLCRAARLPHQASRGAARATGYRVARAPDLDSSQAPDCKRPGRDNAGNWCRATRWAPHAVRQGRGSEPTASAVVADLVDITRLHCRPRPPRASPGVPARRAGQHADPVDGRVVPPTLAAAGGRPDRCAVAHHPILAEHDISIDAVLQRESAEGDARPTSS